MVTKLYKYEFLHYVKSLLPFWLIIPIIAIVNRVIQLFETNNAIFKLIFGSSIVTFVIAIAVALVMNVITAITRFYKNLFTAEGYLTMTLPVTVTQHILVKITTAVLFTILTVINVIISLCIVSSGELLVEIIKAIAYTFDAAFKHMGADLILLIIEFIVAMLLGLFTSLFTFYTCITVGQLAKKNRVLMAFGVYFGLSFLSQIFATAMSISFAVAPDFYENLARFIEQNFTGIQVAHLALIFSIIVYLIGSVIHFFISKFIMSKKLNLE